MCAEINFSEIIKRYSSDFKKVKYDICNLGECCNTYHIPVDETIIAYCKKRILGITTECVIFTDKAFYSMPRSASYKPVIGDVPPQRVEYTSLCKYLIVQENGRSDVYIFNNKNLYQIGYGSLILKSVAGYEITTLLRAIQEEILTEYPDLNEQFGDMAEKFFLDVRNQMRCDVISDINRELLQGLVSAKRFRKHALYLLAEGIFRQFNMEDYNSFVESNKENFKDGEAEDLLNIPSSFIDNLRADLSDVNLAFEPKYTNLLIGNLEKTDDFNDGEKDELLIFAYARANRFADARQKVNSLGCIYDENSVYNMENFICVYGNKQMKSVVKLMINDEEIPWQLRSCIEAMGFTPLHYAIMLGKDGMIERLAETHTYINSNMEAYIDDGLLTSLLDYAIPATIKNIESKSTLIMYTESEVIRLTSKCAQLEKNLKWESGKLKFGKVCNGFTHAVCGEKKEYREMVENSDSMYEELSCNVEEIISELRNTENERDERLKQAIKDAVDNVKKLKSSKNPFAKFLLKLYESSESDFLNFLHDFNDTRKYRMYKYNGFFFMLPDSIELELPYRKVILEDDKNFE